MEEHDEEERKSTTSLWLDGFRGFGAQDSEAPPPPKNWVQFAAFSVAFKLKSTHLPSIPFNSIKDMTSRIHNYLMSEGIPKIKILAGMIPDVKLSEKQFITAFYGYAIDNPENNPVLPVKILRPVAENMKQGCKQMGFASWKYAGLLENSDLVRESLQTLIAQPFDIVLGLDPTKNEYKWFDREYKVVDSKTVYKMFRKDIIEP